VEAFFDFIAPAVVGLTAFVERFWPSLLIIAGALAAARWTAAVPAAGPAASRRRGERKAAQYAIVVALSLATSALTFSLKGTPRMPGYEDDFGYLLAADTFLHGRLTNPPHPLAAHFDSIYTLQQPTYSAIYLPGNGLVLAFGQLIAGRALVGMWIAAALAVAAIFWALRGWVTDGWAFALGLLAAIHPTLAAWSDSFHGGALTACGGALVAGAAGRLRREARLIDGVAFGAGAMLLELTRPYEGLVVAAAFALCVAAGFSRPGPGRLKPAPTLKPAIAAAVITLAGVAFVMLVNSRVTGDPLKLPYVAYNDRHLSAPNFIWQRAGAVPRYEHPEHEQLYRQFRHYYFSNREPQQFLKTVYAETSALFNNTLPSTSALDSLWLVELAPFAAFLVMATRDRAAAAIAAVLAAAYVSVLMITWFTQPHYGAPAAGACAVALGIGFMALDRWRLGHWLARAAFAAMLVAALAETLSLPVNTVSDRTRMIATLSAQPGPHLVLVPESCFHFIFNGADIDRQRIIWARDFGHNDELLHRYADRSVWMVRCESGNRLVLVRRPLRPAAPQIYETYP
jgi:hypothetical protein